MTIWIENPFDSLPIEGYRKQRYWLMAEAFAAAGHQVVYWTSDFSHARKAKRVDGFEKLDGFEVRFVETRPYRKNVCLARILSHRAYAKTWEREALECLNLQPSRRPDVIIASMPPVAAAATGLKLAKRLGAKFVADVQDAWPETFERLAPRGFRWLARLALAPMRRTARRLYREADLVTGVCDRYRELTGRPDYHRAYLGRELLAVSDWRLAGGVKANSQQPTANSFHLAYVGNLGTSYDLKTVVEGLKILRERGVDATLDIAGFGGGRNRGSGIGDRDCAVKFHGMLEERELAKLLAACDIGVIPMRADSFVGVPNKLGEYAAADLRIVSSLEGETAALLAKYGCGATYRPGDAQGFADAVVAARNCRGGRALAEAEFDAVKIYRAYVETCEDLI